MSGEELGKLADMSREQLMAEVMRLNTALDEANAKLDRSREFEIPSGEEARAKAFELLKHFL